MLTFPWGGYRRPRVFFLVLSMLHPVRFAGYARFGKMFEYTPFILADIQAMVVEYKKLSGIHWNIHSRTYSPMIEKILDSAL